MVTQINCCYERTRIMLISTTSRVRQLVFFMSTLCCLCLTTFWVAPVHASEKDSGVLDLSKFYLQPNRSMPQLKSFTGRQVIDGQPFQIDGQIRIYGRTPAIHGEGTYPYTLKGIEIGRKFEDLHLIHHTTWPDVQGQTVAYVCLNYANGTVHIFPIRYGVHVRDWRNLPSYEKETPTDPDTTICWRRAPVVYKAPMRIFKSRLVNPSPDEVVDTMTIVSARNLAAYNLIAATVASHKEKKKVPLEGDRYFDGKMTIRVVDDLTGKPIAEALVLPSMNVFKEGVVGSPFRTASDGKGIIPYPTKNTKYIYVSVEKRGYKRISKHWNTPFPKESTIRLKPLSAE